MFYSLELLHTTYIHRQLFFFLNMIVRLIHVLILQLAIYDPWVKFSWWSVIIHPSS